MAVSAKDHWVSTLLTLVANRPNPLDLSAISLLGEALSRNSAPSEALFCRVLAQDDGKLGQLAAGNFVRSFRLMELYEAVKHSINPGFFLPALFPQKLAYAELLLESGQASLALRHSNALGSLLKKTQWKDAGLVHAYDALVNRLDVYAEAHPELEAAASEEAGSWFPKVPGLMEVLDRSLNRVIGVDDAPKARARSPVITAQVNVAAEPAMRPPMDRMTPIGGFDPFTHRGSIEARVASPPPLAHAASQPQQQQESASVALSRSSSHSQAAPQNTWPPLQSFGHEPQPSQPWQPAPPAEMPSFAPSQSAQQPWQPAPPQPPSHHAAPQPQPQPFEPAQAASPFAAFVPGQQPGSQFHFAQPGAFPSSQVPSQMPSQVSPQMPPQVSPQMLPQVSSQVPPQVSPQAAPGHAQHFVPGAQPPMQWPAPTQPAMQQAQSPGLLHQQSMPNLGQQQQPHLGHPAVAMSMDDFGMGNPAAKAPAPAAPAEDNSDAGSKGSLVGGILNRWFGSKKKDNDSPAMSTGSVGSGPVRANLGESEMKMVFDQASGRWINKETGAPPVADAAPLPPPSVSSQSDNPSPMSYRRGQASGARSKYVDTLGGSAVPSAPVANLLPTPGFALEPFQSGGPLGQGQFGQEAAQQQPPQQQPQQHAVSPHAAFQQYGQPAAPQAYAPAPPGPGQFSAQAAPMQFNPQPPSGQFGAQQPAEHFAPQPAFGQYSAQPPAHQPAHQHTGQYAPQPPTAPQHFGGQPAFGQEPPQQQQPYAQQQYGQPYYGQF